MGEKPCDISRSGRRTRNTRTWVFMQFNAIFSMRLFIRLVSGRLGQPYFDDCPLLVISLDPVSYLYPPGIPVHDQCVDDRKPQAAAACSFQIARENPRLYLIRNAPSVVSEADPVVEFPHMVLVTSNRLFYGNV